MIHVDARYLGLTANQLADIATDLKAENDRLRELAKGLSWCSEEHYLGHPESECPLYDESVDGKCRAEVLMKELGIEVPS